jgi:hypothetical protein
MIMSLNFLVSFFLSFLIFRALSVRIFGISNWSFLVHYVGHWVLS